MWGNFEYDGKYVIGSMWQC